MAPAGSTGTDVRGMVLGLTQDGDVTGRDADVIIISGGGPFRKQEQSNPGFGGAFECQGSLARIR